MHRTLAVFAALVVSLTPASGFGQEAANPLSIDHYVAYWRPPTTAVGRSMHPIRCPQATLP
jgi:hypothetical protein